MKCLSLIAAILSVLNVPFTASGQAPQYPVPRQNLIRSKNSSISIISHRERLNTVREGNQEFIRPVARSARRSAPAQATNGPPAVGMFVSVYQNQQHFAYLDASGDIQDAFFDGSAWHLQKINNGGATSGPTASGSLFVSVYHNQQHFAYLDASGDIQDAFFDGSKWHLQKINNGGATPGPTASGSLFVSVYHNQQHFAYLDASGDIQDAFFDGSKWHLQKINNGGVTSGPTAAGNLFVSVYEPVPIFPQSSQQHFTYLAGSGDIQDAFFDGTNWHLQKINNGGATSGPAAVGNLFVSVYGNQQHFAYCDSGGDLEDAFYDSKSWHLQKLNDGGNTQGLPVVGQIFVSVYQNQQHFAYIDYRDVLQDAFYENNNWRLQQLTTQLPTVTGSVPIQYVVMSVIYAPPGSSATGGSKSSASYGNTSTLGTSSSVSKSFKQGYSISLNVQALGQEASANFGLSQDTTNLSEIDVSKSTGYSIQVTGPAQDGIDHDYDEIWLILNPVVEVSVTGKNVAWALSNSGTTAEIQFVNVGWLKNPPTMPMPAGVATSLSNAGITPAQYAELLARDPFANGATNIDTTRFVDTNTSLPYELLNTSETYTMSSDSTNKSSQTSTNEDSFSATIKPGFSIGPVQVSLSKTDSFTWTNTSTYGTTTESKQQASTTIAGPSNSWTGGTNIDVYYDTIYSTFLFAFDPNSVPGLLANAASVKGTITIAGKPAAREEVLLTVGGRKFRTYTDSHGVYNFYNKPQGAGTVSIRGLSEPISIGGTTVIHNRALK